MVSREREDRTLVKSYRYLRVAMVGVLLCLFAAVIYQSLEQETILSSISAYYYTPAQAIFVGALMALGACMIALQGTTTKEELLLNIGGMFAPIVAIVPTVRAVDYEKVNDACQESDGAAFTDQAQTAEVCPDTDALAGATAANIENNMTALIVVGAVGLGAALLFAFWDKKPLNRPLEVFWPSFSSGFLIYAAGIFAFLKFRDEFIGAAHYVAALGLFACILLVVVVNAVRRLREGMTVLRTAYTYIAVAMVGAVVIGGLLVWNEVYSVALFWLEVVLITLFMVFWFGQTWERWGKDVPPEAGVDGGHEGAPSQHLIPQRS